MNTATTMETKPDTEDLGTDDSGTPLDGTGEMFDRIARRYDFLNHTISMGFDRSWRKKLVAALHCEGAAGVLDVASGTADVALAIARALPEARVTGSDISNGMLEVGREKVAKQGLSDRIELVEADAQALPFDDDSFDAACISFGIRNVPDRARALAEMSRVTRPGGRVVVLELSKARDGILRAFVRLHVEYMVPQIGRIVTGTDAYRYLRESINAFPNPEAFVEMMREAGMSDVGCERMTFGVAHLYSGVPGQSGA